eukprot:660972-Rhodomonas_salina.1
MDAGKAGSYARFCNHSCDNNSSLKPWSVMGARRIAVVAGCDLAAGDEVTVDYRFGPEGRQWACVCGAPNCSGFINSIPPTAQPDCVVEIVDYTVISDSDEEAGPP